MAGMTAIVQHVVAFILHKEGACIVDLFSLAQYLVHLSQQVSDLS